MASTVAATVEVDMHLPLDHKVIHPGMNIIVETTVKAVDETLRDVKLLYVLKDVEGRVVSEFLETRALVHLSTNSEFIYVPKLATPGTHILSVSVEEEDGTPIIRDSLIISIRESPGEKKGVWDWYTITMGIAILIMIIVLVGIYNHIRKL